MDKVSHRSSQFRLLFIRKKGIIKSIILSFSGAPQHLTMSGLWEYSSLIKDGKENSTAGVQNG